MLGTLIHNHVECPSTMKPLYRPGSPFIYYFVLAMAVAVLLLAYTIYQVLSRKAKPRRLWLALVLWTLLPPAWFAFEYSRLYGRWGTPGTFDQFKYGQDVAAKFWAGAVALVIARLLHEKQEPPQG